MTFRESFKSRSSLTAPAVRDYLNAYPSELLAFRDYSQSLYDSGYLDYDSTLLLLLIRSAFAGFAQNEGFLAEPTEKKATVAIPATQSRSTTSWALFFCVLPALAYHGKATAADAGAADAIATVAEDAAATTISLSTEVTGDDPEIYNAVTSGSGTVIITGAESISYSPATNFYGTEYITYDVRSTDSSTGAVTVD